MVESSLVVSPHLFYYVRVCEVFAQLGVDGCLYGIHGVPGKRYGKVGKENKGLGGPGKRGFWKRT